AARLARLVLAEGDLTVGHLDRDEARIGAADAGAEEPGEDVVASVEPQVEWWHRLGGVLPDHRGEGIDVVALEGVDVAGQQLALLGVHRGDRVRGGDVALLDGGPGP